MQCIRRFLESTEHIHVHMYIQYVLWYICIQLQACTWALLYKASPIKMFSFWLSGYFKVDVVAQIIIIIHYHGTMQHAYLICS